jgi:aryl-alcohol dehydrogenase-like predicted oxidoreductase/enamine deaminase RidA (YjgF/YER057c/UK114 family)
VTAVERILIAPGLEVSRVITGLWQIADMERDGRALDPGRTASAMAGYVAAGLTTFDMADHYGSAEVIAGEFRQMHGVPGHEIPLASHAPPSAGGCELLTKWVPAPGPVTREQVRAAVMRSCERLRTERIDLLQFHAWRFCDPSWLDALWFLEELQAEGLIAHLGVTNFDTAHLRVAVETGIGLVSNQVSCSLLDRRMSGRMAEYCAAKGIAILAYGTLAGGFFSERWLGAREPQGSALATWSLMKYKRFIDAAGGWEVFQRVLRAADLVARRHGVSVANVAARYVLEQPGVAAVIVGARLGERTHVEETTALFGFTLGAADRAELDEAVSTLRPLSGDCGDEYRRPPFLTASGDLSHHLDAFPPPYPVHADASGRRRVFSGTVWEDLAGFSRAVRSGSRVLVSGTTATHHDRVVGGTDPVAQANFVIDKIEGALVSLGASLGDVVRTRVFVHRISDWEAVARVHGERFAGIQPANTLVQAELVGEGYLIEIDAEAESRSTSDELHASR